MNFHLHTVDNKVLFLKRVDKNNQSYNGFQWPKSGIVKPQKWDSSPTCENGLFGWAWGIGLGDGATIDFQNDNWIVFSAIPENIVIVKDSWKWKVKEAEVVYLGNFNEAWKLISPHIKSAIDFGVKNFITETENVDSGNNSKQASSGNDSKQASSGYSSKQASSGYSSKQASSGNYSQQVSSGNDSKQASSGNDSKQASSGSYSQQVSSGNYSQQVSSGNDSKQASSGNDSKQASSGNYSQQASSGNNSQQASSGNNSQQASSGNDCITLACIGGKVKTGPRGVFAIAYINKRGPQILVGKVGKNNIKANVWYEVKCGKIVKCKRI